MTGVTTEDISVSYPWQSARKAVSPSCMSHLLRRILIKKLDPQRTSVGYDRFQAVVGSKFVVSWFVSGPSVRNDWKENTDIFLLLIYYCVSVQPEALKSMFIFQFLWCAFFFCSSMFSLTMLDFIIIYELLCIFFSVLYDFPYVFLSVDPNHSGF